MKCACFSYSYDGIDLVNWLDGTVKKGLKTPALQYYSTSVSRPTIFTYYNFFIKHVTHISSLAQSLQRWPAAPDAARGGRVGIKLQMWHGIHGAVYGGSSVVLP